MTWSELFHKVRTNFCLPVYYDLNYPTYHQSIDLSIYNNRVSLKKKIGSRRFRATFRGLKWSKIKKWKLNFNGDLFFPFLIWDHLRTYETLFLYNFVRVWEAPTLSRESDQLAVSLTAEQIPRNIRRERKKNSMEEFWTTFSALFPETLLVQTLGNSWY